jgi:hypothetical protein
MRYLTAIVDFRIIVKPACAGVSTPWFLAEAQGSQRTSLFIFLSPQTPCRALHLGEILFIFFSQKR